MRVNSFVRHIGSTAGLAAGVSLLALCAAAPGFAQSAATAPPQPATTTPADTGGQLGEIIVTAQKRSESSQSVPLSVTAIQGAALVTKGITTVQELNRIDPALQIGQATGTVTTFIRGIGNPVTTAGNEASVPVYIDDVYFVRAGFPFFDLASIDRVEVLKGPQGTLFGRNASGGVISIYTKNPSQKPELMVDVGYGNYSTVDVKGYANLPLSNTLAANFSISYHDQQEGWGQNKVLVNQLDTSKGYQPGGNDYWKSHSLSMRGKVLWEPTDHTKVLAIGYYETSWSQIGVYSRPFPGTVGGTPDPSHSGGASLALVPGGAPSPSQVLPTLGFYDVALPSDGEYDRSKGYGGSIKIDQDLGFADLVSITAARTNKELYHAKGVNAPYNYLTYDLHVRDNQFSQELQLKSNAHSKFSWILGAYYLSAKGGFDPTNIYGPGEAGNGISNIAIIGKEDVKSIAGFTQVTYPIDENTHITGGLRYTHDEVKAFGSTTVDFFPGVFGPAAFSLLAQKFDATNNFGSSTAAAYPGGVAPAIVNGTNPYYKPKFNKLTWKANADHKFSRDVMVYANYARGFKAGTFNTLPLDAPVLKPEVVDAYEIGLKSELLDRHLRLNMALFWNDISSPQALGQKNGLVFLENAGSARTKGVEFDTTYAAADGLTLNLSASYLDAKYRDFRAAPTYTLNTTNAPGNYDATTVNANGHTLPYASKFKATGGIDYVSMMKAGKLTFDLSGNYSSKFSWEADNVIKEPAHFLLDGSVAFSPEIDDHVTLRFWMKNITGEKYQINFYSQASGSGLSSAPGAPRTFGGDVVVKF